MRLARPSVVVLHLALLSVACSEAGAWETQSEVPPPTNVAIDSYNFNVSVRWDYYNVSPKPLFTVEIICYGQSNYIEVDTCVNISQQYCDLTHKISKTCESFWTRVKALVGFRESEYTSKLYDITRQGQIGPPKLNLSLVGDEIHVSIEHPLTPYHKKFPVSVRENITDWSYRVFLWKTESPEEREEHYAERCGRRKCTINLQVHSLNGRYCISAQGISEDTLIVGEESKESCVVLPSTHTLGDIMELLQPVPTAVHREEENRSQTPPEVLGEIHQPSRTVQDAKYGGKKKISQAPSVPLPTNITIDSYNFNVSVRWNYNSVSPKPLFTVEIKCYGKESDNYIEVDTCVNISQQYCDLTHKISKECESFWIRVKALVGLHESEHESESFDVTRRGRIGPPKLNLFLVDNEIRVSIEDPLTPYNTTFPLSVRENFSDWSYKVFLWESESPKEREEHHAETCEMHTCSIDLQVRSLNGGYCISAQGISEDSLVVGEESKESCVVLPSKHTLGLTVTIIVGCIAVVVVTAILTILFLCLKKKNIMLPKSLVTVVRNLNHLNSFEPKPEYNSVISVYKPVSPECEDGKSVEQIDPLGEVNAIDCSEEEDTGDFKGTSSKEEMLSIQEGTIVDIPESEQSLEANVNYSKSVSGQEEMCNILPELDRSRAGVQQPTDLRCFKVSGYDKPHWPGSDSGAEESLVAERPNEA
ncbi:interferon gamma receptor 1 isoform X2 [Hemicordylus capensis]|uniref:interferon gamma receptor 1 isoform X2 n=1 Tax=Hemicordylus capensis TaxID=884348 RepID=UPI0023033CB2|nr:interferon gamma receptor 1 isoform X2 [Hemicordylus capensis]